MDIKYRDSQPLEKIDVVKHLLQKGSIFLQLDSRRKNVVVPDGLYGNPRLVLQIGYDMPLKIPDLDVGSDGIYGTLSFNRTPFKCYLPWHSIFAVCDENSMGMIWEEDVPCEVMDDVKEETGSGEEVDSRKDVTRKQRDLPPYLRVIK